MFPTCDLLIRNNMMFQINVIVEIIVDNRSKRMNVLIQVGKLMHYPPRNLKTK